MIIILKVIALVFFTLAAAFSIKNYLLTRYASGVWGLVSMALVTGVILVSVRMVKEFFLTDSLEVVKICLLPVMMAFILAASFELKRDILRPL